MQFYIHAAYYNSKIDPTDNEKNYSKISVEDYSLTHEQFKLALDEAEIRMEIECDDDVYIYVRLVIDFIRC